ncbi:MAG: hypothetical protein ABSG07_21315 [Terriglobales bacterium]|jgi:hypothetical protein
MSVAKAKKAAEVRLKAPAPKAAPAPKENYTIYFKGPLKTPNPVIPAQHKAFIAEHAVKAKANKSGVDHHKAQVGRRMAAGKLDVARLGASPAPKPGKPGQGKDSSPAVPPPAEIELDDAEPEGADV